MYILKRLLFTIISLLLLINIQTAFAWWVDHFEVTITPNEANTWEAIDLTIEALDKNDMTVTDYDWIVVIFSETDPEAEFPSSLEENTYTFLKSDQWKIKFENAVIFKKEWAQEINVYDLDDDTVMWIWEVKIKKTTVEKGIEISIVSPEEWLTIWENTITVSGSSQKNHTVKIIVNGSGSVETVTNDDWMFEKKIEKLLNWNNSFKAQVLDADKKVVWESKEVSINVDLNIPRVKDIQINPKEVDVESSYEIKVFANEWLTEVNVIINETLSILKEDERESWVYKATIYSPSESWDYPIDVVLKDWLWHEIKELWAWSLKVKKIELNSGTGAKIADKTNTNKELKITWLKVIELKSKSIIQWDAVEWAEWYNVYKRNTNWELELITKVDKAEFEVAFSGSEVKYDYYAIKPIGKTASWELYDWILSDATKVKTWPEILILLILSIFIGWMLFVINRKKA